MAQWRLTLDVPYSFAVEPGFQRDPHHREFRPEKDSFNNTYLDPSTNLLMLQPSFMKRNFNSDFKTLGQWRKTAGWWQESYRGQDPSATAANMFSAVRPAEQDFTLIELLVMVAIVSIETSIALYDSMKWILESNFLLDVDEGFVIHYHVQGDEFRRKRNWFMVMWDNIGLHFAYDGRCRVYEYDRNDLTAAPVLKEEFVFASPGEILNKSGYFVFLPIPVFGLSITHSRVPQKNIFSPSNVRSGVSRGHLVSWPTREISGNNRLFESSTVRIAHNPYTPPVLGFQTITYSAGDYTDAIFDPGFKPSISPTQLETLRVATSYGSAAIELRKADNSGAWVAGTDQQGRVKLSLTPDASGKHTPFVFSYDVAWDPVFATRNTTPLELARYAEDGTDRLLYLEWGEDDMGRFEGKAKAMLSTAAGRAIALRGDATFRLDWRNDDTEVWQTLFGGFAKEWDITVRHDNNYGGWLECDFALLGMHYRFRETHRLFESAFDGNSVGGAVNQVLRGNSLPALASIPAFAANTILPRKPDGKAWRFAPKEGDSSEEILSVLLLFLHTQGVEWRLRHDWDNNTFVLEQKPNLTGVDGWALVAYDELRDAAAHYWSYGEQPNIRPESPEANYIILEGLTDPNSDANRVIVTSIHQESIDDPTSVDYMGRSIVAKASIHGITERTELAKMARRLKDAIAHRRLTEHIPIRHLQMALSPGVQVTQYDGEGRTLLTGWIKWRGVVIEEEGNEEMTLAVDSVWEGAWE